MQGKFLKKSFKFKVAFKNFFPGHSLKRYYQRNYRRLNDLINTHFQSIGQVLIRMGAKKNGALISNMTSFVSMYVQHKGIFINKKILKVTASYRETQTRRRSCHICMQICIVLCTSKMQEVDAF